MFKEQTSPYPEITPINEPAQKLVVMLHGLGSDGHDLISLVPYIQSSMPYCHFFSPHGVEEYDMAPFGYQWFSVMDRSEATVIKLVERNAPLIRNIISQKQKELSLTNKDTVLFGFSQGSMISVYLTLTSDEPYAATISFSGKLIRPQNLANRLTPICLIHGKEDDVVLHAETEYLDKYLTENNVSHEMLLIDNLIHSIDGQGIEFAINFLKKHKVI